MTTPRDLYADLGVPPAASLDEIKAAYRRLAMAHHPDRNPNDAQAAARFRVVAEAYAILSDPERRRAYDVARRTGGRAASQFWRDFPDMVEHAMPDIAELRASLARRDWRSVAVSAVNTFFNTYSIASAYGKTRKVKQASRK